MCGCKDTKENGMNTEKSYKREMLKVWGIRQLGHPGVTLAFVSEVMRKQMRNTIEEVKIFVTDPVNSLY